MEVSIYDVIILGAGPGRLSCRPVLRKIPPVILCIIEKAKDGGQIAITDEIENYPGQMVEGESGPSLIARMTAQAEKFGAERASDTITKVELEGPVKKLYGTKDTYQCKYTDHRHRRFPASHRMQERRRVHGQGSFLLRYL